MDLNKLITKRINEYALNGDANFLDQYGFLITMIAKEYADQQLILSGVVGRSESFICDHCDEGFDDMSKEVTIDIKCYEKLLANK